MKRILAVVVALAVALSLTPPVGAQQDTMAKIKESGVLTIGTRTGSPHFTYSCLGCHRHDDGFRP